MQTTATISKQQQIDQVRRDFKQSWTSDRRPDFLTYLSQVDKPLRGKLCVDLLAIDIKLRRKAGQTVESADYRALGEQAVALVRRWVSPAETTAQLAPPTAQPKDGSRLGQVLNQRYQLERELGRGGMAVVYRACEIDTGRKVAIKMMRAQLTGTARQRFTREFSTIASVTHPNCVEVYEYGECDIGPFFAMELFAGKPADALIGKPLNLILKVLYEIAEAIDYVHSRRIVHRDIKPGNILVGRRKRGAPVESKLTDFGLAKFANTSSSMSDDANFVGTVAYAAPEQIMRDDLDHRADIYAFGVVCYELLSGRHPFEQTRSNIRGMISAHLQENPKSITELSSKVPATVSNVVMQMLAKQPASRPSLTVSLRAAVAQHLGWEEDASLETAAAGPTKVTATFVARQSERRRIDTLISATLNPSHEEIQSWGDSPPASVLFVTGDPGIGKSSLIKQSARSVLVASGRFYQGRCFEGNLSPFQPFVEIVKQLLMEQERVRRGSAQRSQRWAGEHDVATGGRSHGARRYGAA